MSKLDKILDGYSYKQVKQIALEDWIPEVEYHLPRIKEFANLLEEWQDLNLLIQEVDALRREADWLYKTLNNCEATVELVENIREVI